MRRREFVTLLCGAAAAWPLAARAQPGERVRRIGVLMSTAADDAEGQARIAVFEQGLQQLGWTVGRNLQIDYRWGAGDAEDYRKYAAELVALAPDVTLASAPLATAALLGATRTVPIVFVIVPDPVGAGFVASLARPGGNATGFTPFEFGVGAKWLELLKEVMPSMTHVAVIRDPAIASGLGQFAAIQAVAPSLGVDVTPVNARDPKEIERNITAFARYPHGGLIVTESALAAAHRHPITRLAAQHKMPAIYNQRMFVDAGGLISYGPNFLDQFRRAASYVDRILKGEKQRTCRCSRRPSTSWSSTSGRPRRWASKSLPRFSPAPTRRSSEPPRVHHAARRRGCGVVARGACAVGRQDRSIWQLPLSGKISKARPEKAPVKSCRTATRSGLPVLVSLSTAVSVAKISHVGADSRIGRLTI
jgi:putative tryptophan/tyrosine transport system substrate-binding protein